MRHRAAPDPSELDPGQVRDAGIDGHFVVLWRTDDGSLVACDGRCPHQWSPLDLDGVVEGDELLCTTHGWRFATDGQGTKVNVRGRRDEKAPVTVYPVVEEDGAIWVELP